MNMKLQRNYTFLWSTLNHASRFLGILWWKRVKSPSFENSLLNFVGMKISSLSCKKINIFGSSLLPPWTSKEAPHSDIPLLSYCSLTFIYLFHFEVKIFFSPILFLNLSSGTSQDQSKTLCI